MRIPGQTTPLPPLPENPKITAILVSYNTRELLAQAIQALQQEPLHEIIVVDNASADGSPQLVQSLAPQSPVPLKLIPNPRNLGFGTANNQALQTMTGDLALLLNSDARPEPGAIPVLAQALLENKAVAAGGRLLHPDGKPQLSAASPLTLWAVFCEQSLLEKAFPRSPLLSPYWLQPDTHAQNQTNPDHPPIPVAQVMGACLLMRPLEKFDERFFLYCEDTELCQRLRRHGPIIHVPAARFVHHLGASSAKTRWQAVARYNRGKELYFAIHHGPAQAALCWVINRAGALLRLLIWGTPALLTLGLHPKFRSQTALFARVLTAPLAGPHLPPDALPPT